MHVDDTTRCQIYSTSILFLCQKDGGMKIEMGEGERERYIAREGGGVEEGGQVEEMSFSYNEKKEQCA